MNFPQLLARDGFVIEMQLPGGEHIPRRKRPITKWDVGDMSDDISNVFINVKACAFLPIPQLYPKCMYIESIRL
jgi:hypothetical protein